MKHLLRILCIGFGFILSAAMPCHAQEEIIIEMHGTPDNLPDGISVWEKNCSQLTRLLRGKTREYALYRITSVSSYDDILHTPSGKKYALVRYGSEDGDFRKLLFHAKDPQHFIACASNATEVIALQKKYDLQVGLHLKTFLKTYGETATLSNLVDEKNRKIYPAYRVVFSSPFAKVPDVRYFLFDDEMLVRTFASEDAFFEFMNKLSKQNKEVSLAREQQQKEKLAQEEKKRQERLKQQNRPVRKALVSGGTVEDRMYMPRAVNATPLPPLTPGKTPAGTPEIRTQF